MHKTLGKKSINTTFTHSGILCVDGDLLEGPEIVREIIECIISNSNREIYLKWTFRTTTVAQMDRVTTTIVKSKYFPRSGTASDVGGMISARRSRNTVS